MRGHADAIRTWARAGADLVLGGHIHLPYTRELHDETEARRLYVIQAGTAVSSRIRDGIPNSVNLIRYESEPGPPRCVVERWDYDAAAMSFTPVAASAIRLDRSTTAVPASATA